MWFTAAMPNETRRQRNARWREDMERYNNSCPTQWTSLEFLWARRLDVLLNERRRAKHTTTTTTTEAE